MDRPIGFWLKLVDQLIDERFDTTLDEHGVTRRQWQMLNLLSRGASNRAELDAAVAPFLERTSSLATAAHPAGSGTDQHANSLPDSASASASETLVSELDELIESEWITDVAGRLTLTSRGELSHEKIAELVETIRVAMSAEVAESDYSTTTRTLEKMAKNLGWTEG